MGSVKLEEAIAHHRWAAENCVGEVRDEHLQMVGWLEELVRLKRENTKLRELVYDMLVDEEREHNDELTFDEHVERANELGIEVD